MELPLFPLHTVLFPGRPLPLHVFEPRYRRLLADCLEGDRRFGVVAIRTGAEVGSTAAVFSVGTVTEIADVEAMPDGRANITTRGVQRFRIEQMVSDGPYLRAHIHELDEAPAQPGDHERASVLRSLLLPYLASLGAPLELLTRVPVDPAPLAWLAASALQVELPEQQRLLELDRCADRLDATLQVLRRESGIMRHFGMVGSLKPVGPAGADLN